MEAIRSSETSVNARSIQRHITEDDILHSLVEIYRRVEWTYCCLLQVWRVNRENI
jgi:hypothetical protein